MRSVKYREVLASSIRRDNDSVVSQQSRVCGATEKVRGTCSFVFGFEGAAVETLRTGRLRRKASIRSLAPKPHSIAVTDLESV